MMKKWLCLLLTLMLPLCCASALELTDEEFERWFEQMDHLSSIIGVRKITTPGEKEALAGVHAHPHRHHGRLRSRPFLHRP